MEPYITVLASVIFAICHIMIAICSRTGEKKYRTTTDILLGIMIGIMSAMSFVDIIYLNIYMPSIVIAWQTKAKI